MVLGLAEAALANPDAGALWCDDEPHSWSELNSYVNRATNALLSLDLPPGFRAVVFAENSMELVVAHLAILHAGGSTVPVSFHLTDSELSYIVGDCEASIVFSADDTVERAASAVAAVGDVLHVAWTSAQEYDGLVHWEDLIATFSDDEPPVPSRMEAGVMYTSGTTGRPKGVDLTRVAGGAVTGSVFIDRLRSNPFAQHGTHLVVGPLYHTGPLNAVKAVAVGTPIVILRRFAPEAVLRAIERYRIGSSVMVPTHFFRLHALPEETKHAYDLGSLEFVSHTGAACPIWLKRAMLDWWGPVLTEAYGATETGTITRIDSAEWMAKPESVGRVIPPFRRAFAVDDDGIELDPSQEGRLYFEREDGLGIEYLGDAQKTNSAHLDSGAFTLGDVGHVDHEGYVFITGRATDMIVSGGVNIYPAESETVLLTHPSITDVAVIGVPDDEMGESAVALIVRDPAAVDLSASDVIAFCRSNLSHVKCPRRVIFVDSLGRSQMGKLNKADLRAKHAAQLAH